MEQRPRKYNEPSKFRTSYFSRPDVPEGKEGKNESLDNWKTYLAYWVIDPNSPYMG